MQHVLEGEGRRIFGENKKEETMLEDWKCLQKKWDFNTCSMVLTLDDCTHQKEGPLRPPNRQILGKGHLSLPKDDFVQNVRKVSDP
jgi:hypothetical protein